MSEANNALRKARAVLGLTQVEMADALGIKPDDVERMEHSAAVPLTVALALDGLVHRFGLDPESLREWTGSIDESESLAVRLLDPDDDLAAAVRRWREGPTSRPQLYDAVTAVLALYSSIRDGSYPDAGRVLAQLDRDIEPLLAGNWESGAGWQPCDDPHTAAWQLVELAVGAALGGRPITRAGWERARAALAAHLAPWMGSQLDHGGEGNGMPVL